MSGYLDHAEDGEGFLAHDEGSSLLGVELTHGPHSGLSGMGVGIYRREDDSHMHNSHVNPNQVSVIHLPAEPMI